MGNEEKAGKKSVTVVVIGILCVVVVAALCLLGVFFLSRKSDPLFIAHRGYSDQYVDNTAESFRAAAAMNFYGIETDIRQTKDGVYVCSHDETAKYEKEDGSDVIPEMEIKTHTYAELKAKPLYNTKTTEKAYICTLEEYLVLCAEGEKHAIIEMKEQYDETQIGEMLAIIDRVYRREKVCFIDFDIENLLRVRKADSTIPLQYLSETKSDPVFDRCLEEMISISVRQTVLTKKLANRFHAKGLLVNVWTVNKRFDLTVVRIKQADYVTTNLFDEI